MFTYKTTGKLRRKLTEDERDLANDYLQEYSMVEYVHDTSLKEKLISVEWSIGEDCETYTVEALAHKELSASDLGELSDWVSGQNSDGLGEGFEQQEYGAPFDWDTNPNLFR